jgi:hypothetical protein
MAITRVYLSGKISGLSREVYTRNFARAEQHYLTAGFEVVNPVKIGEALLELQPKAKYEDFIKRDLEALKSCTAIAMLEGWESSPGAQREKAEAERLGLEIMQYKEIGGKK